MGKNFCKLEHKWCKFCKKSGCTWTAGFPKYWELIHTCPKREAQRTISLAELIKTVNFFDVMTAMINDRENQKRNILGYANVFETLLAMKPTRTNMQLIVRKNQKWNCLEAYGLENGREYAIEFVPWSEWLCMNITPDSIRNLTPEEIVAGALYEMTFNGYTEDSVNEQREKLEKSIEDIKDN